MEKTNEYLNQLTKDALIKEIKDLYKLFPNVCDYYLSKNDQHAGVLVLDKYKKIIKNQFLPDHGFGKGQLSVARRAVLDYKKVCASNENLADIMLYYVEIGVKYTNEYGDIDEPFYISMENMYYDTMQFVRENNLTTQLEQRAKEIVNDTSGMGWGFHDGLKEIFEQTYHK